MTTWKRYPNRSGAARFIAYFVDVEVLARETRQVTKVREDSYTGSYERMVVTEDWAKIRYNGRTRWVPARDLTN